MLVTNTSGEWAALDTVIERASAQNVLDIALGASAPTVSGASASELMLIDGLPFLSVSPVVENSSYRGCWFFELNPVTGAIAEPAGLPSTVIAHTDGTLLSGMCTYHEAATATATGVIFGEAHASGTQFRLFGTGIVPGEG